MDRPDAHATKDTDRPTDRISRRNLLLAGTGTVLAASTIAACGGDGSSTKPAGSGGASRSSGAGKGGGQGSSDEALAKVSQVPVGGAVSATSSDGKPVIVAQPRAGKLVAFSAICTHQGCTVAPADKILQCPCHGSTYDLATGKNTGGPAPSPLAKIPVKVEGGKVVET
ncbi:MAG TPA: Rieske (2Fe-2S) protein [Nocardioidaceae bacterium]